MKGFMICTPCQIVFGCTYQVEGDRPGRAVCMGGKNAYTVHSNRFLRISSYVTGRSLNCSFERRVSLLALGI